MKRKFNVINISPKYSAIWKCAYNIAKAMKEEHGDKFEVKFVDLYREESKVSRTLSLIKGIKFDSEFGDINFFSSPLLGNCMPSNTHNIVLFHDLYALTHESKVAQYACRYLFHRSMKNSTTVLSNSYHTMREIGEYYRPQFKHTFIHLGIDNIYHRDYDIKKNKKLTIMSVGRDEPRKNLDFVFEILNELKQNKIDFNFIRIGDMSEKHMLMIEQYNLVRETTIKMEVTEEDLLEDYLKSHFLLMPSLSEGFGIPVIEALSCDCIPLTTDKGSLLEINLMQNCLDLYSYKWSDKIMQLYNDKKEFAEITSLNKERAKSYTWKNYVDKLVKLI